MAHAIIYTKEFCPFCHRALATLDRLGVSYTNIDVQHDEEKFEEMVARSGRHTVPQIFWHIGGNDDMEALLSNETIAQILTK